MQIKQIHPNFTMPTRGSDTAGGFDIYMPEDGTIPEGGDVVVNLGFASAIPEGYVAFILPRSGAGAKHGIELRNTCGVIDADYRGEWMARLKTKEGKPFSWFANERLLQFVIVPVLTPELELTAELSITARGAGGFGSTGQ